jgi:ElaA protein
MLRSDGRLGGCLRLVSPPALRIGRVAVAAALRGRGLARALMREALARCAARWPAEGIALTAQLPLAGFYESLGFRAVSEPFDDFGLSHIDMRRPAP